MGTSFQRWLHGVLQGLLLCVPKLSEMRLATGKVMTFLRVWHYLSRAGIKGDYLEFGVFEGMSFNLSLRAAGKFLKGGSPEAPRFFAFDSFQGLPENHPTRDTGVFEKGTYQAGLDLFKKKTRGASKGWETVVIPGFYQESLVPGLLQLHQLKSAAFINIDCDLYDSTLAVLRFVTPLVRTGTVIYFDDWFFSGGNMKRGEPGACSDWLSEHPKIKLVDFGNVGIMGKLFIVNLAEE